MPTNDGKVIIQIDTNAAKAAQDVQKFDNAVKQATSDSKIAKAELDKHNASMKNASTVTDEMKKRQAELAKSYQSTKIALADTNIQLEKAKQSYRDMQGGLSQSNNATSGLSTSLMTLKGGLIAAGVAFGAMKLKDFAGQIFDVSSQFEQLNVAFGVLAGQQAGAQLVKDLTDLANVTPMTTQGLADNARLLLSFGEASNNVITDLKLLGDITGGNQEKMNSMTLAFAQAGASGRLMGQDLLQMVNAGFNPLQQISEKTGKSMGQLKKEMEAGKIGFDQIKQSMIDATSEGGRFYGMMNKQSQTLQGQLSTLADKWSLVGKSIGDYFLPMAKGAVGALIKLGDSILWLEQKMDNFAQTAAGANSKGLEQNIKGYKAQAAELNRLAKEAESRGATDRASSYRKQADEWMDASKRAESKLKALSNAANNTKTDVDKIGTGFKTSTPEVEKHSKKVKEAKTEYDLLQDKINKLSESLKVMALHHQENTTAFKNGKTQLMQWQTQLESANKAVEKATILNPYEKLQSDLQQATTEMQNLAAANVVNADKFKNAKDRATELAQQLERIQQVTKIDTTTLGSYDALSQKISKMKDDLQNMAVSGQAGTPAFDALKNDFVKTTNEMEKANRQVTNAVGLDWSNIKSSISSDLATAFTTPLQEGETAFERLGNVAMNTISMIGQALAQSLIISPLIDAISGTGIGKGISGFFGSLFKSADGNVFNNGSHVQAYAKGGVVSSPTLFPMANGGTGLMGEAGAEAVMPLRRTSSGRLGVEASNVSAIVNIYNQSTSQIETVSRPNGDRDIFIRDVNNALSNERTQRGFSQAMQRNQSKGVTAA